MPLFTAIKFGHIALAIMAVGFNVSYGIWIARAAREPEHLSHVLRGIQFFDDKLANPGYVLLLLSGLAMVFVGNLPLTTFWIAAALVLWLCTAIIGLGFYTPTLRKQIQALEAQGANSAAYTQLANQSTLIGIINLIPVLLILILMVFRPTL